MVIKVQKRKKKKRKKNLKKGDSFGAFATSSLLSDTYVRIFFTHHYHHPLHLHLHLHIFTFTTTLLFLSLSLSLSLYLSDEPTLHSNKEALTLDLHC